MSSKGKRLIASFFGIHLDEDPPELQSLVPKRISDTIINGNLPKFHPSTINLRANETCHFMDKCALAMQLKEKSYLSKGHGSSYRMTKNFTLFSGTRTTRPVEQNWYEFKEGVIFITNQRIIFIAPENGFDKSLKRLTAFQPYSDAVTLQFGSEIITVMMPKPHLLSIVLQMLC